MDSEERKRRVFIFLTFLLNCVTIGLLSAALGTDFWIVSRLRDVNVEVANPSSSSNNDTIIAARQTLVKNRPGGHINFGLFHGFLRHNKGLGDRQSELKTFCEDSVCSHVMVDDFTYNATDDLLIGQLRFTDLCNFDGLEERSETLEDIHLFSQSFWTATIALVALGILIAAIAGIYGLLNATYTPVAVLNGIAGLYLWNSIGILCTLLSVVVWVVLFYATFQYNVLPAELLYPTPKFSTCGLAQLGYSFWFCLASMLLFVTNVVLLTVRDVRFMTVSLKKSEHQVPESLFMY